MKSLLAALTAALLLAPVQEEDWLEELRKMDEQVNAIKGPTYVMFSLRQEMARALKALDESRLDAVERQP